MLHFEHSGGAHVNSFDLLVVGGGINGVGIARDAVGRGLSVCLCEKDDFASHTSSWSTKLIHGGLRYLEHHEFRLVRESLIERETLLDMAPHLVEPLRFVLPLHRGMRPAWLVRLGLFLYDYIGGRKVLPATTVVDLKSGPLGAPLSSIFQRGFEYTDCRVDDSRLVVANAMDAAERGAVLRTRTRLDSAARVGAGWQASLCREDGGTSTVMARAVVNAAGPWVNESLGCFDGVKSRKKLKLVKGSHIMTRRLFDHDRAYIFQNADDRIIFAIPYVNDTTLIGTTDIAYSGEPAAAEISAEEVGYLCASISEYFSQPVTPADVVSSFSGVRPLYDELGKEDASAVTRDYAFDIDMEGGAPLLSVYGGKLTTYRKLAEHALARLAPHLPEMTGPWTKGASLPGGDTGYKDWQPWLDYARERYGFLEDAVFERLARAYGTRLDQVLGEAASPQDLGRHFGGGLFECEVRYGVEQEFVRTVEDLLTRRTKLWSVLSVAERAAVAAFIGELQQELGRAA